MHAIYLNTGLYLVFLTIADTRHVTNFLLFASTLNVAILYYNWEAGNYVSDVVLYIGE